VDHDSEEDDEEKHGKVVDKILPINSISKICGVNVRPIYCIAIHLRFDTIHFFK
jgi:hypothetical protein